MIDVRRRHVLTALSAAAGVAVAAPFAWRQWRAPPAPQAAASVPPPADEHAEPARFAHALRMPGRDGLFAELPLSRLSALSASIAAFDIFGGAHTELWHYAAEHEGRRCADPLLRAQRGERVRLSLRNQLREATTVHWHGLAVDEANDGSGLHPVAAGAQRDCDFSIDNRAGLYWYHAHPHGRTGAQLQRGMAGLLLIEDEEERALQQRLGLTWGERDLPLMIADKQVDARNAIIYKDCADDWIGNRVLVNWTPEPYLDVAPALYRFRLANVANARMLRPAFVHRGQALPMLLIGTDGGLLERPWPVEDLFLAPAQRADVLVDFSALAPGERALLRSLDYVAMENEDESGAFQPDPMADHPGAVAMGDPLDLMELRVVAPHAPARPPVRVPERMSALPPLPDTEGWPVRALRLRMDDQGRWFINDWNFHLTGHEPAFSVRRGSREVWELRNSMTSMPHPIHIHGLQFRVLSRSISPPDIRGRKVAEGGLGPQDLGWNDTVVIWPGEIVRLALDFDQPWRGTQRYMLHCHNLEHEDMGMMISFAVTD
ncbi:multicopper oxidase family protein [Lysobacter silvisoli]|uniref:Multicopper oxidase CueO n=1 Tax=Lysobacter silvisoli TaxID=2293254 RepID=A0A371JW56_9GAMM|nr:multicopper oxidase domain-containing protein [Lysobacter silvisoli]RDZ25926.1 Bilirubin oxidase [Lysobacter silvisoli]